MKRIAIVMTIVMTIIAMSSVASFAWFGNAERPQYEWTVPKVNDNNPAVVFDGKIDLEGEWFGALDVVMDFTDKGFDDELTMWTSDVWGAGIGYSSFDEVDDYWKCTMHNLFMYDSNGVYWATFSNDCKVFGGNGGINPDWINYWINGTKDSYDGIKPHNNQNMWIASDDPDARSNGVGYLWLDVAISATEMQCWAEDNGVMASDNDLGLDWAKKVFCGTWIDGNDTNGDGYYEWGIEFYMPWEMFYLPMYAGVDGWANDYDLTGSVGQAFQCGIINRLRCPNDPDQPFIQYCNCYGWANYDLYVLGNDTVADAPLKEVEIPEVDEEETDVSDVDEILVSETEEITETEPENDAESDIIDTESESEVSEVQSVKNTTTSDLSVIFYTLAFITGVTALLLMRKK